jgi:ferrochelatase
MASENSAVVLVNLGTPDAPTPTAVRRYLKQFLSDPRVVETPALIWFWVLRLLILPLRPRRVAKLYASIWEQDSPIRVIAERQAQGLAERLGCPVRCAMSYGHPGFEQVLDELMAQGHERLVILPLYPQYSGSTTGAVADALARWLQGRREVPGVELVKEYWREAAWQNAVAASIGDFRARHGEAEKLLFSFHGIPLAYQNKGDRYGERCRHSASAIAERLGLRQDQWAMTFQSRFGPQQWLSPYTDKTLARWGQEGVESVQVVCPGFAADCLETLEEINSENRQIFLSAGGGRFDYIPALNDQPGHLDALADILRPKLV